MAWFSHTKQETGISNYSFWNEVDKYRGAKYNLNEKTWRSNWMDQMTITLDGSNEDASKLLERMIEEIEKDEMQARW